MPLMVNAMTGGGEIGSDINEDLSSICKKSIKSSIYHRIRWH